MVTVISATNPVYAAADGSVINVTLDTIEHGVIEFSACATDTEELGRTLHAAAVAGEFGPVAGYVPPPAVVPDAVTMRQARLALLNAGLLTQVNDAIEGMTGAEGAAARIEWEYATSVQRDSPLVADLSASLALTAGQLDALFVAAAAL